MLGTIRDKKYVVIKNFITPEVTKLLSDYTVMSHRLNFKKDAKGDQTDFSETGEYGAVIMEALLVSSRERMEKETGLRLRPTYSFWRMYNKFSNLAPHKDRPACEISVTVQLGSDGTDYPLIIGDKEIVLQNGDAVAYLGCEVLHSRNEYEGDWHSQCFLHYVDLEGRFAKYHKDGRKLWGDDANESAIKASHEEVKFLEKIEKEKKNDL